MSDWKSRATPASGSWKDRAAAPDYEAEATLAADKKYEETKPGALEASMYGIAQGGLRNFGDEIARVLGGDAAKAAFQDRAKRSKDDQPAAYTTGEIASKITTLPSTANPLAAAGIAAADAAASGVGDDKKAGQIATESASAGVTAGLITKFLPMLTDAGRSKVAELMQKRADSQAIKALGGSQGQIQNLGDKAPEVAQFARDNILSPFASSKTLADRAASVGEDLASQTKPIYEQAAGSKMPREELVSLIDNKIAGLKSNPGNAPIINKLEAYKQSIFDSGASSFNPADLKDFRQAVAKTVNFNSEAPAQLASKEMYGTLRGAEMGQIEKIDPALRQANEKLFKDLHLSNLVEDMADKGAARSAANNDLGMNTWHAAQLAANVGGGPAAVVMGALREGARRFGPQLQGIYLDKAAKAMQNPKFAQILQDAAQRGPEAAVAALSVIDKMVDQ